MLGSLRAVAQVAALAGCAAGIAYTALAIARVRAFRKRTVAASTSRPPISILKPLHGNEPQLYENLRSFCAQEYPEFQVVFTAAKVDDPALGVARRLAQELPECDITIVAGKAQQTPNPKIGNLLGAMDSVKHNLIVIADSDMRAGRGYLRALAAAFADGRNGAVTCIYGGTAGKGIASQLGAQFVNDSFAPSVMVATALEPLTYCFGATMGVRRDLLERIGGLVALSQHLGDDYRLGQLVTRAGYRVALAQFVVHTHVSDSDLRSLWRRELRWARTILGVRPAGYAGSIVTYPLPFAFAYLLLTGSWLGAGVLGLAATARLLLHNESRKTFARHTDSHPWLIPLRDFLGVAVWAASFLGKSVHWRRERYGLAADGRMAVDQAEM